MNEYLPMPKYDLFRPLTVQSILFVSLALKVIPFSLSPRQPSSTVSCLRPRLVRMDATAGQIQNWQVYLPVTKSFTDRDQSSTTATLHHYYTPGAWWLIGRFDEWRVRIPL